MPPVSSESNLFEILERLGLSRGDPETVLIRCLRLLRLGTS